MIAFDLRCAKNHVFEAWFASGAAFDKQAGTGGISCPFCGDRSIAKALMAPNVAVRKAAAPPQQPPAAAPAEQPPARPQVPAVSANRERIAALMQVARELRAEVEKTCEYVGPAFADEARKIHYGESEQRNIYGETSPDDAAALKEEGIEFGVLPWPSKTDA